MIDCNMPMLPAPKSSEISSSAPSSEPKSDKQEQNFSTLVEHKTITDEQQDTVEKDENQDNSSTTEGEDVSWMSYWLCLTQAAAGAAQRSDLSTTPEIRLASESGEEEAVNLTMSVKGWTRSTGNDNLSQSNRTAQKASFLSPTIQSDDNIEQEERDRSKPLLQKAYSPSHGALPADKATIMSLEHSTSVNPSLSMVNASQNNAFKSADFSQMTLTPPIHTENMSADTKIMQKNILPSLATNHSAIIETLDGVEVIRSRRQGDLTILQLQLNPENLGRIDARLKMDDNQLMVELSTHTSQAAKLLEKDQQALMQVLEKAGVHNETRLNIHIIERSGATIQSAASLSSTLYADATNTAAQQDSMSGKGEHAAQDFEFASQQQDKKHQTQKQEQADEQPTDSLRQPALEKTHHALNVPRRLIV